MKVYSKKFPNKLDVTLKPFSYNAPTIDYGFYHIGKAILDVSRHKTSISMDFSDYANATLYLSFPACVSYPVIWTL